MNDTTQKVEDRFHNAQVKNDKPSLKMIFCPQGNQIITAKQGGYKFTEGNEYGVLERKDYKIKVVDDSGAERWVKEDYFTLANQALMHDKDCGFTRKQQPNILWNGLEIEPSVPDVRKVKLNKGDDDPQLVENSTNTKALAGVCGLDYHHHKKEAPKVLSEKEMKEKGLLGKNQEYITLSGDFSKEAVESVVPTPPKPAPIPTVKENALLNDIDKLWEKMGTVFPEYRKVNSDGLMDYIKAKLPNRRFEWKCSLLYVDGCATNINKTDVNAVFDGLKKLTTPKMADKLVGKVIVSKLKKLF